ncbi:MAG TPA: TolC family protein [Thermoanaerobaculia bacterium]|nr:TolC family protein [Thermoanaerobaculia bacterium]
MPRARIVLSLLLALGAQETSTLTEEDFLAAVISDSADHPAVAALAGEREIAAAEAVRASLLPNPVIEASVEEPDGAARETVAGVTWTPPLDGRRALRREAAAMGVAAAESRLEAARLRLRLELRAVYADWALAWERRELLAAHLARVGELAERSRARAAAGEIPGLAARRFTLEEAQARADLGRAEARLASAWSAMMAWVPGLAPSARPALPALASPGTPPDLAGRPDLVAREREVERAEAVRRLSARVVEAPALGLGWKRIEERSATASGPVVSVDWTVPLFGRSQRRQADRLEAEARLSAARVDLELARARAAAERAGALAAYQRFLTAAADADRSAADVDGLLTGATAAYQVGESGLTDLLDTLRAALGTRLTTLEIREAALAAQRDLEAAIGANGASGDIGATLSGDLP